MRRFYLSLVGGLLLLVSSGLQAGQLLRDERVENFPLVQLGIFAFGALAFLGDAFLHRPGRSDR